VYEKQMEELGGYTKRYVFLQADYDSTVEAKNESETKE